MGILLKAATSLIGSGAMNPASQPEAFVKIGRKLYTLSAVLITWSWYTGWRRLRGEDKARFPIPGLAKRAGRNVQKLSELPGLAPFKVPLGAISSVTGVTGATDTTSLGPSTDLGQLPSVKGLGQQTITILQAGKLAQQMGLHVGENPLFGGVHAVHVATSLHYSGRAIDVSAPMTKEGQNLMAHYANVMAVNYGAHLTELFWRGPSWVNIKNGVKQARNFVDGHQDHVHVGI